MLRRFTCLIAMIGMVSLAACTQSAETEDAALDDTAMEKGSPVAAITQQEVEQSTQQFLTALQAGDVAGIPNRYAPDAVFISASGNLNGGDAIKAFWTDAAKAGKGKSLAVTFTKFGASGDLAYTVSRFTGGVTAAAGHTIQVWQRMPDGTINIVAQISIPDSPGPK